MIRQIKYLFSDKDTDGIEEEDLETLDDDITPFEVLDARKEEEKEALLALVKGERLHSLYIVNYCQYRFLCLQFDLQQLLLFVCFCNLI